MIGIKNCGVEVTDEDYKALNQTERKRLGQLMKVLRANDRSIPEKDIREKASIFRLGFCTALFTFQLSNFV
jgi:hypothetical protein